MLCVASHYHEIPGIISDQREFIVNEKRDWTSCEILLQDVSKEGQWRIVKFKIEAIITRITQTVVTIEEICVDKLGNK